MVFGCSTLVSRKSGSFQNVTLVKVLRVRPVTAVFEPKELVTSHERVIFAG